MLCREVVAELKAAGATWIQFDEPTLVKDLDSHQLQAFTHAYSELESSLSGLNVIIESYFADVPAEAYKTLTSLKGVAGYGFDLVCGTKTLDLIKSGFPSGKYLFAGVVDGRNIWANDLASSISTLEALEGIVGKDKVVVSTSCSLLHTAVDLVNETKLDAEIKSWLAFAAQKVVEVNALAKALSGHKDEAFFAANAAAQASRKSSPRVTNEHVQKSAAALKGSDLRRATNVSVRLDAQQKKLSLPVLPTTTIGSFPQTMDLRRVRREYKAKKISEENYVSAIKEEINKVIKLQEELDIDRNDMVEYFGEQLSGFAFTVNGWVQSYGSCCVKPPIIYGDVSRPKAMTVFWSSLAQSLTKRPMKGMLTGPVTILNWSFVRNDQPRSVTCYQIALAIKDEVEDLEKAVAFFAANATAQASRKSSTRVTNEHVQKSVAALKGSDHRRATNVSVRLDAQQKKLSLPVLPSTTIGSFPQTMDLRRVRRECKAKIISEENYVSAIKEEINKVVKLQEELDIDVLVHGEPEHPSKSLISLRVIFHSQGNFHPRGSNFLQNGLKQNNRLNTIL
ncbi:hypothetical protein CsatB_028521 [Cannabis sativa]